MAYSVTTWNCFLALALISVLGFNSGKCENYIPEIGAVGGGDENLAETGYADSDPTQIVEKALICFNDRYIYSACNEEYRLTQSGNLNVPLEYTDEFCHGPCSSETHLVLNCIQNIFSHFEFFNEATIRDVKETIEDGCRYGPRRGNFDVVEHIRADEGSASHTAFNSLSVGILLVILGMIITV